MLDNANAANQCDQQGVKFAQEEMAQMKAEAEARFNAGPVASHRIFTPGTDYSAQSATPLLYRLRQQLMQAEGERAKYRRAVEILERHPQFEELVELLHSGVI